MQSLINSAAGQKSVVSGLTSKIGGIKDGVSESLDGIGTKVTNKIAELSDKWNLKTLSKLISEVAGYKITDESLEALRAESIPDETVTGLRSLANTEFAKESEFLNALKGHIGEEQAEEYKDILLKHATITVKDRWEEDITKLVSISKNRGFKMSKVERLQDQYMNGDASWRRVETEYWNEMREQTRTELTNSIERFRTKSLGCSDFTVEMRKIWEIQEKFNEDEFEGFVDAKTLSLELLQPRSEQFLNEFLHWLAKADIYSSPSGNWSNNWLIQQLRLAIPTADGNIPDYPAVINRIDARADAYAHPIENVLKDLIVAEIFLNYDLITPAEDRFDEALRNLSELRSRYQHNPYSMANLGLHMTMGLLHERICKNNDLAIKEFKDVVAIAKRLGLACQEYSIVHYHLGVINMDIRAGRSAQPEFEESSSDYSGTTDDLMQATPTPTPIPPTPTPQPLKIDIGITIPRALKEADRVERPAGTEGGVSPTSISPEPVPTASSYDMGVVKGTVDPNQPRRLERDIRLRPREELGLTIKMKKFDVNDLYDLSKIPDDAAREFELYLKCINQGDRATIARFIHQNYIEN